MNNKIAILLAACFGFTAFSLAGGLHILNMENIGWLLNGDPAQHWIGWQFFRNTPLIQWPLGLNPAYGMELKNSIVFTDSIPVIAIIFKYLSPLLPEKAQYTGLWIMSVYTMQAISSYLLVNQLTKDRAYSVLGTVLFLTASAFIYRATGHFALSAQWVLIMSIYLYLQPTMRWKSWAVLVVFTSLVHAYLLAMTMTILLVSAASNVIRRNNGLAHSIFKVIVIFAACGFAMYAAGYFTVTNGIETNGYGYYKSNLNTFINPVFKFGSHFLPVKPSGRADYEGMAYLGLGSIILVYISIVLFLIDRSGAARLLKKHWVIITGLIGLSAFAVSGNVMLNAKTLINAPVPEFLSPLTSAFRASGRFMWPSMYAIITFGLVISYRRLPKAAAYSLLLICITAQGFDSAGWFKFSRVSYKGSYEINYDFNNQLWKNAEKKGKYLVSVPRDFMGGDPVQWAYFAATHGMHMNFGYFARFNTKVWAELAARDNERVVSGNIDPEAVYIFASKEEFDHAVSTAKLPVEVDESNGYHVMSAR